MLLSTLIDPPVPLNINQFSSVSISWTESSSDCVTGYRYNVSSEDHQILNTTSNSPVTVEGLVPSYDLYYVVINSFDAANRNSSDSDTECVYFNGEHVHTIIHLPYQVIMILFILVVPPPVNDSVSVTNTSVSDTEVEVVVTWEPVEYVSVHYKIMSRSIRKI